MQVQWTKSTPRKKTCISQLVRSWFVVFLFRWIPDSSNWQYQMKLSNYHGFTHLLIFVQSNGSWADHSVRAPPVIWTSFVLFIEIILVTRNKTLLLPLLLTIKTSFSVSAISIFMKLDQNPCAHFSQLILLTIKWHYIQLIKWSQHTSDQY